MTNIVAHPETGQPVLEQTSYVELDKTQLEAEVAQAQSALDGLKSQLDTANAQVTSLTDQHSQAEAALADKKSLVGQFDQIQAQSNAGAEGASSEVASDGSAGTEPQPASEPAADSGASDGSAATVVPVSVEASETPAEEVAEPADEY